MTAPAPRFRTLTRGPRRRGAMLIYVVIAAVLLLGLAGGVARLAVHQTRDMTRYETYKDEFAAAEVAVNRAYAHIQHLISMGTQDFPGQVAAMTAPSLEGYEFIDYSVTETFSGFENFTSGQWEGLQLQQRRISIDATVRKTAGNAALFAHPGVRIVQDLELTYIPLFHFAIFYDPDLEIAPGPAMDVIGRVHTNGAAYLQAGTELNFHQRFTAAGSILHGTHPNSGQPASGSPVDFFNGSIFEPMSRAGDSSGWLDSQDGDWTTASRDLWNDWVRDEAHGVGRLSLQIPVVVDPHTIIERADPATDNAAMQQEMFEYQAGLVIVADASGAVEAFDADGNSVPLTYPDPEDPDDTLSIVSVNSFYDAREDRTVSSLDIDMGRLLEAQAAVGGIVPANGILYVSNEDAGDQMGVVRLINCAQLPATPAGGFSIASDDPVYLQGDFNTIDRQLAMVAGDAISILSNAWDDENSTAAVKPAAAATEINAVMIQGDVPSSEGHYSGGVENYFRFLENWTSKDLVFNGSIINLFHSQTATGRWGSDYYSPPRRIWSWDPALGGIAGPPGAPRVVILNKTSWQTMTPIEADSQ